MGGTTTSFAGSLRQSQIGLEVFGPEVAGAKTSASINFDFSGGFANEPERRHHGSPSTADRRVPDGLGEHLDRRRAGHAVLRAALADVAILAGDSALSYSGNLWVWAPQIRVEHRVQLTDNSKLLFQAGIMDSLTGNPVFSNDREPSAGEQSGQPAYAARVAWSHRAFGRDLTIGVGGYYGRQKLVLQPRRGWLGGNGGRNRSTWPLL